MASTEGKISIEQLKNSARAMVERLHNLPPRVFFVNLFTILKGEKEIDSFDHFTNEDWRSYTAALDEIVVEFFHIQTFQEAVLRIEELGQQAWDWYTSELTVGRTRE